MAAITIAMWVTDLYAMRALRSVCRMQISAQTTPPRSARVVMNGSIVWFRDWTCVATRSIPYPPSLRRMPARIIEPATGAST